MKYSRIVTLDFETFYGKEYSLRSQELNTSEYIRDPRFKVQCVGLKVGDDPVVWYRDKDVRHAVESVAWSDSALLAHNAAFDGFILSHHFGVVPAFYLDTLSMARALHSNVIGAGLDEVAQYYKLGNKLPEVLGKTKDVLELPDELMTQLGQYCALDVELCRMIFDQMVVKFPQPELDLIDLTVRMFCDPVLKIDIPRVEKELRREQTKKRRTIAVAQTDLATLSSADKFATHLMTLGLIPPGKISPRTGKVTWAFSKNDLEFIELKNHSDKRVRRAVRARLAAKSTIGESRAYRFLQVGKNGQKLPVALNYFGAHTGRWSAGNKMNLQNLRRGGELRKSILAPEGHVLVVADSAQIEARTTAWLAKDAKLLELFASGGDVYKHMAAQIYLKPVEDVTKDERFIGKICILGLGYGMGAAKLQHTLATGAMGPPVHLELGTCQTIVNRYRQSRGCVQALWRRLDCVLFDLARQKPGSYGPLTWDDQYRIWLPNQLYLQYPFLSYEINERELPVFTYYDHESGVRKLMGVANRDEGKKIYGALLTENVVQALSRVVIGEQMLRLNAYFESKSKPERGRIVTMTHDEIVACVSDKDADTTLAQMITIMRQPPEWAENLPLNAEGGYDRIYSK